MASRLRTILAVCAVACVMVSLGGGVSAQRGDRDRGDRQRGDQRAIGQVGITIFAEPGFQGQNSNFRTDVPDLRKYNMNDRVNSLQLGRGEVWEVCQDKDYRGRCQVFSGNEANLGRVSWNGMISSLRRLPDDDRRGVVRNDDRRGDFPAQRSRLVLFEDDGYRGRSFVVTDATPSLRGFSNRVRSIQVDGGSWELCDGESFRGRCETVTASLSNLGRIGLHNNVSSARPVGRNRY